MKVVFGFKAHSGWAALVALARNGRDYEIVARRRVELVDEQWAKQPYHAAEELPTTQARDLVKRGVQSAHRIARRELQAALKQQRELGNDVTGCAVLVGNPMPDWNVDQILAVHFRMHQAEGVLFREALVEAAKACHLKVITPPEKTLLQEAEKRLRRSANDLHQTLKQLGKAAGSPWGRDQKDATLAALIMLS
jgi:hypothetical protein